MHGPPSTRFLVRFVLLAVFTLSLSLGACTSLTGRSEAPLYSPGSMCATSDQGAVIPCPGSDGVTFCAYQQCDTVTNIASTCEAYDCATGSPPPPYFASDGSTGCTPGARAGCTTPGDFRPGVMYCDVSGNWMMCIPNGSPYDAGVPGDAGMSTACNTDPDVVGAVTCTVGRGACAGTGVWMCNDSDTKICSATASPPTSEGIAPDGVDNDCNGLVDDGITRGCYSGPTGTSGIGVCVPGTQSYDPGTMTWSPCAGEVTPTAEIADNAVDEDCNGALLFSAPCGADPRVGMGCSAGIGACMNAGTWSCVGTSLVCSAVPNAPAPEMCDNLDNDCDGLIDGNVESCYSGPPGTASIGLCRSGTRTCSAGVWGACAGEVLPALEVCGNASDEDCNGINDACVICGSDPRVGNACAAGIGACLRTGTYVCAAGLVTCDAVIGAPVDESCNAIDDDCDGSIDEMVMRSCGLADLSLAGRGDCRAGTQACMGVDAGGAPVWSTCIGAVGPTTEVCGNAADEDCNGSALACTACGGDTRIGMACTVGRGACATAGTYQCMSGSDFRCVPSSTPPVPTPEVCDGVDNDCNGAIDDPPGGGVITRTCYPFATGLPGLGVCVSGTQTCASGTFGACTGAVGPSTEVCDALDNDCDGGTNEGLVCGGSDAGAPMSDAGSSGMDAGVSMSDAGSPGTDSGTPGSDAGTPPGGSAAGERAACRDIRAAQGFTGTVTVTYDLACINATFGTSASWSAGLYDQNGCFVAADPGGMTVTMDLANTSDPFGFYRTGLRNGGPGGTRFAWPGPQNGLASLACVTSYVVDGIDRLATCHVCPGAGGLLPTCRSSTLGAAYTCAP